MAERQERCETCRFWDAKNVIEGIESSCRRLPPMVTLAAFSIPNESAASALVATWPRTEWDDWCGEYQPAP